MSVKRLIVLFIAMFSVIDLISQDFSYMSNNYKSRELRRLRKHLIYLSSSELKGRAAASEGELLATKYLYRQLDSMGLDLLYADSGDTFDFLDKKDTLKSRNLVAFVPGSDKDLNSRYIVISTSIDNIGQVCLNIDGKSSVQTYYGANSKASAMAVLIELADRLNKSSLLLGRSLLFAFYGASRKGFIGSWFFLNRSFSQPELIDAMIDLAHLGSGDDNFSFFTPDQDLSNAVDIVSHKDLLQVFPHKSSYAVYPSDYVSFHAKNIPFIYFSTGFFPEYDTVRDTYEKVNIKDMQDIEDYLYEYIVNISNQKNIRKNK